MKASNLCSEKVELIKVIIQNKIKRKKNKFLKYFLSLKKKRDAIARIEMDKSDKNGPEINKIGKVIRQ